MAFMKLHGKRSSITLGSDCSLEEWKVLLIVRLQWLRTHFIFYRPTKSLSFCCIDYSTNGEVITMDHRIRLCPYYFINEEIKEVQLRGVLATLCQQIRRLYMV